MNDPFDEINIQTRSEVLAAHRAFVSQISQRCSEWEVTTAELTAGDLPVYVHIAQAHKVAFTRKAHAELEQARTEYGVISQVPLTDFAGYLNEKRSALQKAHHNALAALHATTFEIVTTSIMRQVSEQVILEIVQHSGAAEARRYMLEQFDAHFSTVITALANRLLTE